MRNASAVAAGAALSLGVHAVFVVVMLVATPAAQEVRAGALAPRSSVGWGLCGKRRCSLPERRQARRAPEEDPLEELEVLEAAMIPALGMVEPDPSKLPELQVPEAPEIVEEAVNLEAEPPEEPQELPKDPVPREERRDRTRPKEDKLADLLRDLDDDPRRRATRLDRLVGHKEGELGGQGTDVRAGNLYSAKVSRALRKVFVVPPFLGEDTLSGLRVRVLVTRLSPEGEILAYKIQRKSGNRAYDDAAVAAVREFVPEEGGSGTLPRPDPDVLRWVNEKGMKIDLDGSLMSR